MNKTGNNPYVDSWEKELANKSFAELVRIVALKEQYNEEFVEMAQSKLIASEEYEEGKVNAMIETIKKEPRPKQNVPADTMLKVGNVGCITMKVLFGIMAICIIIAIISTNIKCVDNIPVLISDTPIIFIFFMGVFYITSMKKMAVFKPSISPQSRHQYIKGLGVLCIFSAVGLWLLLSSGSSQSDVDVLYTMDFTCVVVGWAVYCFFFKKSDSGIGVKLLKLFYGILLTLAYLGCYTSLLSIIIYGIIASFVPIAYSLSKRHETNPK